MTIQIAIDLTPLRPGGENGGAKNLTWELLNHFKDLTTEFSFLLLTADWNHDLLATFDGPGFSRLCVLSGYQTAEHELPNRRYIFEEISQAIRKTLPLYLIDRLRPLIQWLKAQNKAFKRPSLPSSTPHSRLTERGINLLFCPFTAVTYAEPGLTTISFVHDIQHRIYPQFFDPTELNGREATYRAMAHRADIIICNSNHTRQTLLSQFGNIPPDQILVIPISIHTRLKNLNPLVPDRPTPRPYLFYPANFWPHKNHRMLLTAYNALRHKRPNLDLDLVFTGSESEEMSQLKTAVSHMNLTQHVHFLGYLTDEALAAVYQSCLAIIYPSLFEGFGIPLLEAYSFNKPVLCSNVTSLPEVAGEAALYFNPRKPTEIIQAIETLLDDPAIELELVKEGQKRLAHYDPNQMIEQYRRCFKQAINHKSAGQDTLHGRYDDGWLGSQAAFSHQPHNNRRQLILTLLNPAWNPHPALILSYLHPETKSNLKITLIRGETITLTLPLPPEGGHINLTFSPTFQPAEHEGTADTRQLSCILEEWKIDV